MPRNERYYSGQYTAVNDPVTGASTFELDQYANPTPYHAPAVHSPPPAYNPAYGQRNHYDEPNSLKSKKQPFLTRKKKIFAIAAVAAIIIIAIAVGVGVGVSQSSGGSYDYTPLTVQVTNDTAFTEGGATKQNPSNVSDGIGAGTDEYTYYSGTSDSFPDASAWISFEDMWAGNLHTIQHACGNLGDGKNNSPKDNEEIYEAIQNRANASLVDHRFILAIILQESHGCVRVGDTQSSSGITNPGLMQSHNGHKYSSKHSNESIIAMVQDGTQGTSDGDGLVQNLNNYGNAYRAARGYNSGYIPASGNLSEAAGATACYVSDVANRLTGWANATNKCTGTKEG